MKLLAACVAFVLVPTLADAQEPATDKGESDKDEENQGSYRGRISTSAMGYAESASRLEADNEQASTDSLLFGDLRARLRARNVGGSDYGATFDFRARFTPDDLSARGYLGGREYNLREASAVRESRRTSLIVGRQIVRDVDATRIDGAQIRYRAGESWEHGVFGGSYPNPFSRSLETDYEGNLPAAGGVFSAYRGPRSNGALGVAAVAPRDRDLADPDPLRVFLTANGYRRVARDLDLFHYAVADVTGAGGAQLLNAHAGANWRLSRRLRLEAGYSHMSTYGVEVYVRDYLESADPDPEAGAPVQNNLTLVRIGSDEGRLGANLVLPARLNVYAAARLRRRNAILDADLPMEIAALPADTQLDLSGGIRRRKAIAGIDLGANTVVIRGGRTRAMFTSARARRGLFRDRLSLELEATRIDYEDRCDAGGADPTCTGGSDGRTLRVGGMLALATRHWLLLSDYRFSTNKSERDGLSRPTITAHTAFLRAQYSF